MLKTPKQYSSLKLVRPISWDEIFEIWKKGESQQESWKKHWESRGFESWDEWREMYISPLTPKDLKWFLFEIENPTNDVPNFYGVPSRSWIEKAYQGEKTKRLGDILKLPIIADNDKIISIKQNFPQETCITGIISEDNIIIYEGMHRSSAIASWDSSKQFPFKVFIALALWDKEELPTVGGNYKKK